MSRLPGEVELSADEARRLALCSQGLLGPRNARAGARGVLRRLGAVQLDTISVLARSHELVVYARLGAVPREQIEAAYWSGDGAFEYWSHAASILPMEYWPWFAMRRRRYRDAMNAPAKVRRAVLRAIETGGPQTARELGGARAGTDWWDWSPVKRAAEQLLAAGELVCVTRRAWHRVYDLTERAIPVELRGGDLDDRECKVALARDAARGLGVGTLADLADYHRQRPGHLARVMDETGLVPVRVAGWEHPAWADPDALTALARGLPGGHRTTLLSPFDSLIWDRARMERIFGMSHRLEAYTPAAKRVYGYFAMPVLAGGRLVARVDPARQGRTLVARTVTLERPSAARATAAALVEAASWVGCDNVSVERVVPRECERALKSALSSAIPAT